MENTQSLFVTHFSLTEFGHYRDNIVVVKDGASKQKDRYGQSEEERDREGEGGQER